MALQQTATFASLPSEIQRHIFRTYLGDSFARLAYLEFVFSGREHTAQATFICESFSPRVWELYFNDGVSDLLDISTAQTGYQRLEINMMVQTAGQGSGLAMSVYTIARDHSEWLEGSLLLRLPCVYGWMEVSEYTPSHVWHEQNEPYFTENISGSDDSP